MTDNNSSSHQMAGDADENLEPVMKLLASEPFRLLIGFFLVGLVLLVAGLFIWGFGPPGLADKFFVFAEILIVVPVMGVIGACLAGSQALGESKGYWWVVVFGIGMTMFTLLIPATLQFLVTNGASFAFPTALYWFTGSGGIAFDVNGILTLVIPALLVGLPSFLYRKQYWKGADGKGADGADKQIVIGWLAVAASLATGMYGFVSHFIRGPMQKIPLGPLSVAILLAVLVLVPIYRSLAEAFSEQGIVGVCHPAVFWGKQKKAAGALLRACQQSADASGGQDIGRGSPEASRDSSKSA